MYDATGASRCAAPRPASAASSNHVLAAVSPRERDRRPKKLQQGSPWSSVMYGWSVTVAETSALARQSRARSTAHSPSKAEDRRLHTGKSAPSQSVAHHAACARRTVRRRRSLRRRARRVRRCSPTARKRRRKWRARVSAPSRRCVSCLKPARWSGCCRRSTGATATRPSLTPSSFRGGPPTARTDSSTRRISIRPGAGWPICVRNGQAADACPRRFWATTRKRRARSCSRCMNARAGIGSILPHLLDLDRPAAAHRRRRRPGHVLGGARGARRLGCSPLCSTSPASSRCTRELVDASGFADRVDACCRATT